MTRLRWKRCSDQRWMRSWSGLIEHGCDGSREDDRAVLPLFAVIVEDDLLQPVGASRRRRPRRRA